MIIVITFQDSYGFFFYWIPLGINLLNLHHSTQNPHHDRNTCRPPAFFLLYPTFPAKRGRPACYLNYNCNKHKPEELILHYVCSLSHARNLERTSNFGETYKPHLSKWLSTHGKYWGSDLLVRQSDSRSNPSENPNVTEMLKYPLEIPLGIKAAFCLD